MRIVTLLLIATAACSPYSPDLGRTPFLCGSADPKCPDGYTCVPGTAGGSDVCVQDGTTAPDAPNPNGMCADDSQIETMNGPNNDSIATAYTTPVAVSRGNIDFAGLSICPAGDKDYYTVVLTKQQMIDVSVVYEAWGGVLQGSILLPNGNPVATLAPQGSMTMHAATPPMAAGTYYVEVEGPAPTGMNETRNNYTLSINVTPYP